MLVSKFVRFLISVLNWQVNSSSNFASFFIVMTHDSPVNFKLIHFLLWIKGPHQSPNYETVERSGKNLPNSSCHFWKHKSSFPATFALMFRPSTISPLYSLSSKLYTLVKSSPLKCKFLRFSSARLMFVKFLMPVLNCQFLFKFASFFIVMTHNSPAYFEPIHFLLWIKGSHQSPNSETFECSG